MCISASQSCKARRVSLSSANNDQMWQTQEKMTSSFPPPTVNTKNGTMTTVVNKAFLPFLLAKLLCRRRMQVWTVVLDVHNPGSITLF